MNFIDRLKLVVDKCPNKKAFIFLQDGATETITITFAELDIKAKYLANHLRDLNLFGERVILLYPSGIEVILAFMACLYAGVIAIPVATPHNRSMLKLSKIIEDASARQILTTSTIVERCAKWNINLNAELPVFLTDNILAKYRENTKNIEALSSSEDIAFIQYTSGSTGAPKGVCVTHGNLLYNQQMIMEAFMHTENSIILGWLPFYHDMGLIGNILHPIYMGCTSILMPPEVFAQKPFLWLKAISKYRATTSGGPNFAYDLCNKRITSEEKATLDLSCWKVAFNGAEPISSAVINEFVESFAICNFNKNAIYPCYGMAEATLFITGGSIGNELICRRIDKEGLNFHIARVSKNKHDPIFVSCGKAWLEEKVIIVDPETSNKCLDKQVGEIWVSGKNIAQGYWKNPESTSKTFNAFLGSEPLPYLRTGDLGFIDDSNLFITGRIKDLIIIRGRNYYPQDIETCIINKNSALAPNGGAAFTVNIKNNESLVIVQEIKRSSMLSIDINKVLEDIRSHVLENFNLHTYAIVLIKSGSLPKTSSGKIQRKVCQEMFLQNTLKPIKTSIVESFSENRIIHLDDTNDIGDYIKQYLSQHCNFSFAKLDEELLTNYGLDSLTVMELKNSIEEKFNISINQRIFFESVTLFDLINEINRMIVNKKFKELASEYTTSFIEGSV